MLLSNLILLFVSASASRLLQTQPSDGSKSIQTERQIPIKLSTDQLTIPTLSIQNSPLTVPSVSNSVNNQILYASNEYSPLPYPSNLWYQYLYPNLQYANSGYHPLYNGPQSPPNPQVSKTPTPLNPPAQIPPVQIPLPAPQIQTSQSPATSDLLWSPTKYLLTNFVPSSQKTLMPIDEFFKKINKTSNSKNNKTESSSTGVLVANTPSNANHTAGNTSAVLNPSSLNSTVPIKNQSSANTTTSNRPQTTNQTSSNTIGSQPATSTNPSSTNSSPVPTVNSTNLSSTNSSTVPNVTAANSTTKVNATTTVNVTPSANTTTTAPTAPIAPTTPNTSANSTNPPVNTSSNSSLNTTSTNSTLTPQSNNTIVKTTTNQTTTDPIFECCTQIDKGKCTACDSGCSLYQERCFNPRLCSIWDQGNNCLVCIDGYNVQGEWCVKV